MWRIIFFVCIMNSAMQPFINTVVRQIVALSQKSFFFSFSSLLYMCILCSLCLSNYQVLFIILFLGIFLCCVVSISQVITTSNQLMGKKFLTDNNLTSKLLLCSQGEISCRRLCCYMLCILRNCKWLLIVPQNKINLLIGHLAPSQLLLFSTYSSIHAQCPDKQATQLPTLFYSNICW